MTDYRVHRRTGYLEYHAQMNRIGDCDPAYALLAHVAEGMGLTVEQRLWLAWLYATCYNPATAFYMFTANPDYAASRGRFPTWWREHGHECTFSTDRRRAKPHMLAMFESYAKAMGPNQGRRWSTFWQPAPAALYKTIAHRNAYRWSNRHLLQFGRFTLFLYLEAVQRLTGWPMEPDGIDLRHAESCRKGLCYAIGTDHLATRDAAEPSAEAYERLQHELGWLLEEARLYSPDVHTTYWNLETSLCGYKKLHWGTRYLGYYIDRAQAEIRQAEQTVPDAPWHLIWEARAAIHDRQYLGEFNGWDGPRPERLRLFADKGIFTDAEREGRSSGDTTVQS